MMTRSFEQHKTRVIQLIWEYGFKPGSNYYFTKKSLADVFPQEEINGMTSLAIDALTKEQYLRIDPGYSETRYFITDDGIKYAEFLFLDSNHTEKSDAIPTFGIQIAETSIPEKIPASDRLVSLDHNGDLYKDAIISLENALTEFRGDHRLDNEWGPEKGVLIRSIEAGRELLDQTEVRVATVFAATIIPLQIVRERYSEAIAAGLVTAGADQLIYVIGHALGLLLSLLGLS